MADRNQRQQERRREAFRKSLAETDADEIRARLADRRIRSAERVAIAEAVLRERAGDGDGAGPAREKPSAGAINGGDGGAEEKAARAPADGEGAQAAADAAEGTYARQIGHQIGRMVGMGLGVVGLAAVALLVLRR
jgi:hypothetical protein